MKLPSRLLRFPVLTIAFIAFIASFAAAESPAPIALTPADWPMLAHDPARSGSTIAQVEPPATRAWVRYFHLEGVLPCVQPVSAAGRVYFGTLAGSFYAIDAASGANLWVSMLGSAVLHTAAVARDGVVVAGCADGKLRALDARNGVEVWTHATPLAIWNAPLAHAGRILFGGRDGRLRALRASDGELLWSADTGAPIVQSPALDVERGRVFVTSEAMRVHAFDAATGRALWRSAQLGGLSAGPQHPVVLADGRVLVSIAPLGAGATRGVLVELDGVSGRISSQSSVLAVVPGWPAPPAPVASEDQLLIAVPAIEVPDAGPLQSAARFDLSRGAVVAIGGGDGIDRLRIAAAGDWLVALGTRHGQRVSGARWRSGGAWSEYYATRPGTWGTAIIERLVRSESSLIELREEDIPPAVGVASDVAASGGPISTGVPPIVIRDRIIILAGNKLLALRPSPRRIDPPPLTSRDEIGAGPWTPEELEVVLEEWPIDWDRYGRERDRAPQSFPPELRPPLGTRERPDDEEAELHPPLDDARLDKFIYEAFVPGPPPDDEGAREVAARLGRAVAEFVAQPRWMPLRFPAATPSGRPLSFLDDPSEALASLALAYPFLDADSRRRVAGRVAALWSDGDPILDRERDTASRGQPRELYHVPLEGIGVQPLASPVRRLGIDRAWPLWLWSHASDDWSLAREVWPRLRSAIDAGIDDRDEDNARCAGLMAMVRIARELDDVATVDRLLPLARAVLRTRIASEIRYSRGRVVGPIAEGLRGLTRWSHLTPDLARILRIETPLASSLVFRYLDQLYPHWFLAWGPISPSSGDWTMQLPPVTLAGFLAKALLGDASTEELSILADIPCAHGDSDHIQKLAITLLLASRPTWIDVR